MYIYVCVCIYIYVYVCVYVCVCISIYLSIYIYIYMCVCVCVCVSNFLTNFWMQHFDGVRLSPNSVRNAIWHALNVPVCQYLLTRNPRCSTVYIDNNLGPLARVSPCIFLVLDTMREQCGK